MTYGKLKQRIYSLLDLKTETGAVNGSVYDAVGSSLVEAVNSSMRKTAALLKCCVKRESVTFVRDGSLCKADLPDDFISLRTVYSGGKKYAAQSFDAVGDKIYSSDVPYGTADVFYYAYPTALTTPGDNDEMEFDDLRCDITAYGAALELCGEAYPGDYDKYRVIATEYDERMANALIYGGRADRVTNALYGKRRLI